MTPNNDKRKKIVIALVLATIVVILSYIFNNYVVFHLLPPNFKLL